MDVFVILPAIRTFDLKDYVLNCKRCPEKFIQTQVEGLAEMEQTINEDFLIWKKIDQLIVCWLFSTFSESIFGQVTHCTIAYEVWTTLESLYSQQSKARVLQLKNEMNSTKKGVLSINDYVLKMKSLSESLTTTGHSMAVEDVISSVLGGLGPEYDPVVVTVTAKQGFISLQEVAFVEVTISIIGEDQEDEVKADMEEEVVLDFTTNFVAKMVML
ncbi:hypothetical protein ACOSQ3_009486 [Xanthoceras sorbifolium]